MFKEQEKIYNKAVELVCEECGITTDDLRLGRNRVSADARFILVQAIAPYVCDNAIASKLGRTRQGVCFIRNKRMDKSLSASCEQVRSKLYSWLQDND